MITPEHKRRALENLKNAVSAAIQCGVTFAQIAQAIAEKIAELKRAGVIK